MSKFEMDTTKYIVTRTSGGENGVEEVLQYNEFNNTIYWYGQITSATEFETREKAEEMAQVQEMLTKITGKSDTFEILVKNVNYTVSTEESAE